MNWQSTNWNKGMGVSNSPGGFKFAFPTGAGHVNAIQTDRAAYALNDIIVIKFKIMPKLGKPRFKSLDDAPAPPSLLPNFRPMLQVKDDDYVTEDNRWWPTGVNCAFLSANADGQPHELRIPVKPNMWSNVFGKMGNTRTSAFLKVVANPGKLNIVFGGGNSFSHGIVNANAKSKAIFQLLSFNLE